MNITVKTIQPTPPPKTVVIELSEYEAGLLLKVVGNVGGDCMHPIRRDLCSPIWDRLRAEGISPAKFAMRPASVEP